VFNLFPTTQVTESTMEAIETRYRTHTCGQLRSSDVAKNVKLADGFTLIEIMGAWFLSTCGIGMG